MVNPATLSLQRYYIYDPNVGAELGGSRVQEDKEGRYVLANTQTAQYWIDQGLLGTQPLGKLSDSSKQLLAQITRGRSKDQDARPKRVPRYNKAVQSGTPAYVGSSGLPAMSAENRRKARQKNRLAKQKEEQRKPAQAATK